MASSHEQAAPGSPKLAGGTLVPSSATEKAAGAGAGASSCSLPATLSPYWYTLACWGDLCNARSDHCNHLSVHGMGMKIDYLKLCIVEV